MAINKRKVLEAARKYVQKDAQAKALKEFGKLLKLDPRDARLRLEVADAHRRWGNEKEAIETYTKVAEQYMKEGFDARAVAVYKQIHNLAPTAYESYEPLADLYQRMGLVSEAILALQTAADGYHKEGKKKEALALLRKLATLDPANTTSRIKVADLLRQEELFTEATREYVEASAELERQGDRDGAVAVYNRILEIDPNRMETLQLLAENLIERGLGERAEPFAKRILAANPDEPAHYELMAAVYRLQKRDEELVATYRELADLHRRRGDDEQARDILQRYVPAAVMDQGGPIDDDTAYAGMVGAADLGESGTFDESYSASADAPLRELADATGIDGFGLDGESPELLGDDGSSLTRDDSEAGDDALDLRDELLPESDLEPEPTAAGNPAPEQVVVPPAPTGDPEQLLAEASVYLRYGKRDQAIANLEAIIEQDPEHRTALEKLGEAYADGGDGPKAVDRWLRSAELARNAKDGEGVAVLRDRIAAIDEDAAARLSEAIARDTDDEDASMRPAVGAEIEATLIDLDSIDAEGAEELHEIDLGDIEIDLDASEISNEDLSFEDDAQDEVAPVATPALDEPSEDSDSDEQGSSSAVAQQLGEDLEEADFYMKQGLADEAEVIYKRVLSIAPNHPHALVRLGEVAASRGEDPSATKSEVTTSPEAGAGEGILGDGGEAPEPNWNDDIAGPDDLAPPPPALEDSVAEEISAASQTESASAEDESSLDDDLAEQFLADVAESEGSRGAEAADAEVAIAAEVESPIDIDIEVGDVDVAIDSDESLAAEARSPIATDAGGADAESGAGPDIAEESESDGGNGIAEEVQTSADIAPGVAAEESAMVGAEETLGEPCDVAEQDPCIEPGTSTGTDDGPRSVTSEDEPEISSPDDSFADSSIDLGEPPELVVPTAAAASEDYQPVGDDSFDLAAELSDIFDDDADGSTITGLGESTDGFEAVFSEFKKGVSQALSEDDHEAHFDLGIAYREMGLLDDAKSEFQAAMLNVAREVECWHMLGMCCFEQGQYEEAISQFERIAVAPATTEEQRLSAQFELGRGWEALGEPVRARTAWEAVAAVDQEFCDVSSLLAVLDEPEKPEAALDAVESLEATLSDVTSDSDADVAAAGDADPEPDTGEYESFDGFLDDDGVDDEVVPPEKPAVDEPISTGLIEPAGEAVSVPEPDPETAAEEPPAPRPRKRKKISFV